MNGNNIVLIGMMGAGKTSVGKELQKLLTEYNFIDVDEYIEIQETMTITEIFQKYTEKGFRQIEEKVINKITQNQNQIISIGGGAFENELNRTNLLNSGKVFYLYTQTDVLYDRIKLQGNRPMLQCENPKEKFIELFEKRNINYQKADFIIDTTHKSIENIAKEILRRLNESADIS